MEIFLRTVILGPLRDSHKHCTREYKSTKGSLSWGGIGGSVGGKGRQKREYGTALRQARDGGGLGT